MGADILAFLIDWNAAIEKHKKGTFHDELHASQKVVIREGHKMIAHEGGWIESPRSCRWERNGHLWQCVEEAVSQIAPLVRKGTKKKWDESFSLIFPAYSYGKHELEGPFSADKPLLSLSPPTVKSHDAKMAAADFLELEPLYDKVYQAAAYPWEELDEWGVTKEGFFAYLRQWPLTFKEAADKGKGLLVFYW